MVCERPPSLASLASPPHEGEINASNVRVLFSPSVRGRAAEGGRGSLTHHLEFELGNTPEGRGLEFRTPKPRSGERILCRSAAHLIITEAAGRHGVSSLVQMHS